MRFILTKIIIAITLLGLSVKPLLAQEDVQQMIGQMLIIGFRGTEIDSSSAIVQVLQDYRLGGVILFNVDLLLADCDRNILNPKQLQTLTTNLINYSPHPLFISVDQEGGMVSRLNKNNGFISTPSAGYLGELNNLAETERQAQITAKMLSEMNININFAPVVDLNINLDSPAIGKYRRSYSNDPQKVTAHSQAFIKGMKKYQVLSCLKHFPGHGSSIEDSHLGITDITETWIEDELIPYRELIQNGEADMIMVGHLMNRILDEKYPATLSKKIINDLLRQELSYDGVIISDDLNMKAITDNYTLEDIVFLAIDAGTDILLFSNNIEYNEQIVPQIHKIINSLIETNKISQERIKESYQRIMKLKSKL